MTAHVRRTKPTLQGFLLGLLLFAWLSAQSLGLAHRSLHAGALEGSPLAAATQLRADSDGSQAHTGLLARLFGAHTHASDCLLYDHAGAADLLACDVPLALPAAWAPPVAAQLRAGVPAQGEVPFQARAPPSLR